MAKEKTKDEVARPSVTIPATQGQFHHHADGTDEACVTERPAPSCACGAYELAWEK